MIIQYLKRCACIGCLFGVTVIHLYSQEQVRMTEELLPLPTYKVKTPEKAPVFYTRDSFQGASRYTYPLVLNDQISGERTIEDWKFLTLENEYIKLGITPDIGGKIYYATDKTTGYNFVYKNNEVKPANIGMTGAWVSGGIEWCTLHHHRASSMMSMDYSLVEHDDGSRTVHIGETEPRHGMRWSVGTTVHPGKSYFECEVAIYNSTPNKNTFLHWANVAAHTNNNYQTIFPPSVQMATYHNKVDFVHWPIAKGSYHGWDYGQDGVDISWWKNVPQSASFFTWDLQEDFMGGYDHGKQAGTVHVGDHNIVKGAKLWEWGCGERGQRTEGRLTETSGPYVEIMVGAYSDNQPDYSWIMPYETKRWKHYWYPVRDIKGFKNANIEAAVNLEQLNGDRKVFLGYYATQERKRVQILLKNGDEVVLRRELSISPKQAFAEELELPADYQFTDLYTEMVDLETGDVLVSYQPENYQQPELPPVVKAPLKPEEIKTNEELYLVGKRIEQFYNPKYRDLDYFEEALKRDPNDIRVNTTMGRKALLNGDFENAERYLAAAIGRITHSYNRPETCEALYLKGLVLKVQGNVEEAIDMLYRATWDYGWHSAAYFELAQLSCGKGDFEKALYEIEESLATNNKNTRAIGLKSAILRHLGRFEEAEASLTSAYQLDPLNFRLGNEVYLVFKGNNGSAGKAKEVLDALSANMREFEENYLELAVGYVKEGLFEEAWDVLNRIEHANPIVHYYRGYIADQRGNQTLANKHFSNAKTMSEDYCFPYRLESVKVLEKALEYDANDAKALYYIGNIFYDKLAARAIQYYERAVKADPKLAIAWRNLGWGYYRHEGNFDKAIEAYEKAIELNDQQAIYYAELDKLYELNNNPIASRLVLFDGKNKIVRKRDDSFLQQAMVLNLAGKPEKTVEYLEGMVFSFREGTSRVREITIDAHLQYGIKLLKAGKHDAALKEFLDAQVPEEEAGSSKYGNRMMQVNYFLGQFYESIGDDTKATEYYQRSAVAKSRKIALMSYYQGLSLLTLGKVDEANVIFEQMVERGTEMSENTSESDFYQIFGEKETEDSLMTRAYTIRALGWKGLGKTNRANQYLQQAIDISVSNLWAGYELEN